MNNNKRIKNDAVIPFNCNKRLQAIIDIQNGVIASLRHENDVLMQEAKIKDAKIVILTNNLNNAICKIDGGSHAKLDRIAQR